MGASLSVCFTRSLLELSPELQNHILSLSPTLPTLLDAILSCRTLYNVFKCNETRLVSSILQRSIPASILPDAIARYQSSLLPTRPSPSQISLFLLKSYQTPLSLPLSAWTLSSGLSVSRFRDHASSLSTIFYFSALLFSSRFLSSPLIQPPSPSELLRIERALYRFEIANTLFTLTQRRDVPSITSAHENEICSLEDRFLSIFAPWENEQLACISKFLRDQVHKRFMTFAEDDTWWEDFSRKRDRDGESRQILYFSTRGLETIFKLITTTTQQERDVFQRMMEDVAGLRGRYWQLAFERMNGQKSGVVGIPNSGDVPQQDPEMSLEHMSDEEQREFIRTPFFDDPDEGPERAWRWAHQLAFPFRWVDDPWKWSLREWGYVFWDMERVERLGIFASPWSYFQWLRCPLYNWGSSSAR